MKSLGPLTKKEASILVWIEQADWVFNAGIIHSLPLRGLLTTDIQNLSVKKLGTIPVMILKTYMII